LAVATIFDGMDRDQVIAEALRYREMAAKNGTRCFSLTAALKLARQFGIHSSAFCGDPSLRLADWVDAGMQGSPPWPSSPFAQKWLTDNGYSDCNGKIGIRATMTLADQH
jgi:hypothetical protein